MDNLFALLLLASMGGIGYGAFQGISNKIRKKRPVKKDAKKITLISLGVFFISVAGVNMTTPPTEEIPEDNIALVSSESTISEEELKKIEQEEKEAEEKKLAAQVETEQNIATSNLDQLRLTLADLEYKEEQTIELNDNSPLFGPFDLSLEAGSWEEYGDLDQLNRATSAEAMLNQDLMPTEKRGDISNVEPTGWKNKKLGKSYLYNRSHLIGFALSGENDNWKNLITGTAQLNNPEMLRHEMDIKHYLEQDKDNYVRYSVTPIFKDDELLARGVHLMARSVNDDEISFNVYIHNIQDGAELNYADGSSVTDEELKAEAEEQERIAAEKAEQERIASEQAEAARVAEENRLAEEATNQQATEQTVYIATNSGSKYHFSQSCRGLSRSKSTASISLSEAQAQGYTLCGWED